MTTAPESAATKCCARCDRNVALTAFNKSSSAKDGLQTYCRDCNRDYQRTWTADNRDRVATNKLWTMYRLRPADLAVFLDDQDRRCALCRRPFDDEHAWHVDHDHRCCRGDRSCGRCVRGLLCGWCNTMIGWIERRWPTPSDFADQLQLYLQPSVTQLGRVADF